MNRTVVMMVFVIFITLIFLQFSCGTTKEYRTDNIPAEVEAEDTVEEALLLADKHEAAGVECNDCHEETPPSGLVSKSACLTCHEDYKEVAASYLDPHNAHMTYSDCGDCHHAHRPGEKICQGCHSFNLQAP